MFIPVTMICDTGAPTHLYINDITRKLIGSKIVFDELDNQLIQGDNYRLLVNKSPELYRNTNILGLMALSKIEMAFKDGRFGFNNLPEYF